MSQEVIQLAVTLFKSRHELYLAFETNVYFARAKPTLIVIS